jgi:AbrB family looped-hinge helix DNA binding protein
MKVATLKKKARITSKGQITVPHEVRRALGVRPGDTLLFEQTGTEFRVSPVRMNAALERYQGIGNPGIPSGRKRIIRHFRRLRGR